MKAHVTVPALSLIAALAAPAIAEARPMRVDSSFVDERDSNDGSPSDETYITTMVVHSNSSQNLHGESRQTVWSGEVDADDEVKRGAGPLSLWYGEVLPGDSVVIVVMFGEQDDGSNNWIIDAFGKVLETAGPAVATALGGPEAGMAADSVIRSVDIVGTIKSIPSGDELIGGYKVVLTGNADGSVSSRVYAICESTFLPNGRLELHGDGSKYYPQVRVNDVVVGEIASL